VSAGWVAAQVRSRGLARHRVGRAEARRLAAVTSLPEAIAGLTATSYGKELRPDMDLAAAQHAVSATALWNLRVLAGWAPPLGAGKVRLLAAGFELDNIVSQSATIAGLEAPELFAMGSLAAVRGLAALSDMGDVRRALEVSPWGDPGTVDVAGMRVALEFALARRVAEGVHQAATFATSSAWLTLARSVVAGAPPVAGMPAAANARAVLGDRWESARSLEELRRTAPRGLDWVLEGASSAAELWRCEVRWWRYLEDQGLVLLERSLPGPGAVVGVAALLCADAWQVRAALEAAVRGGGDRGVLDDAA